MKMHYNLKFKNITDEESLTKIKRYLETDRTFKQLPGLLKSLKKKIEKCNNYTDFKSTCDKYENDWYPVHTLSNKELEIEAIKRITHSAYQNNSTKMIYLEYAKLNTYELQRRLSEKQSKKIDKLIITNKETSENSKRTANIAIIISMVAAAFGLVFGLMDFFGDKYWQDTQENKFDEIINQL